MPRAGAIAAFATLLLAAILLGCGTGVEVSDEPSGIDVTPPAATAGVEPTPTTVAGLPGQTETEWGPIWNEVPPGFPVPPSAVEASSDTPVSAAWTVPGGSAASARATADLYGEAFSSEGLGGGVDGPLEDGSFSTWASSGYGCDIVVTVLPRGDEQLVTVLYGTGCPFSWSSE